MYRVVIKINDKHIETHPNLTEEQVTALRMTARLLPMRPGDTLDVRVTKIS